MTDPALKIYRLAQKLTKEEKHDEAACAFERAAAVERTASVPDIEKIRRWEMAASRQYENAEAAKVWD